MKLAIFCSLAVLVGCAAPPTLQEVQARVGSVSNLDVCRAIVLAPQEVAEIAREEAERRSLDCGPYTQAILEDDAARRQAARQPIRIAPSVYQALRPAPSRSTHCTSRRIGYTVQTDCY